MKQARFLLLPAIVPLLLVSAAPGVARAGGEMDALLETVPSSAALVVAVDHARMSKQKNYPAIMGFMRGQGWTTGFYSQEAAALYPGKNIAHSVTFRMANDAQGSILSGALDLAATEAWAKARLGPAFETGKHGGTPWFTLDRKLAAADLGGGKAVVAPRKLLGLVVDLVVAREGKPITKRAGWGPLAKEARAADPAVWSVGFVPKRTRKMLEDRGSGDVATVERLTFAAKGEGDLALAMVGHAATEEGARTAAKALQGKIDRKIKGSAVLRGLGVAALASNVKITTAGKRVLVDLALNEAQIGLIARLGGTILSALR